MSEEKTSQSFDRWTETGKIYWFTCEWRFFIGTVSGETETTVKLTGATWVWEAKIERAMKTNKIDTAHATGIEVTLVKSQVINFFEWPHATLPEVTVPSIR